MNLRVVIFGLLTSPLLLACSSTTVPESVPSQRVDQGRLSDIALTSKVEAERAAAVRKIADPALLRTVALESEDLAVISLAARKIEDPQTLYEIVQSVPALDLNHARLRKAITARINDPELLREVALNDSDHDVQLTALRGVRDQKVLEQFARDDKSLEAQAIAVCRLEDRALLGELHQRDPGRVGAIAALRLALLEAHEFGSSAVMSVEVEKIYQSYISNAAPSSVAGDRIKISLRDRFLWRKEFSSSFPSAIAVSDSGSKWPVYRIRIDEIELIDLLLGSHLRESLPETVRLELARRADSELLRAAALWTLSDDALAAEAIGSRHSLVRRVAIRQIDDQALLSQLAHHDTVTAVRVDAIKRLTNGELLDELENDSTSEIQRWARIRRAQLRNLEAGVEN